MNKKADFTIEEFLRILISVLVIVLLVVLAVKLYGITQQSTKEDQARIHLDNIEEIFGNLFSRHINRAESFEQYFVTSPNGWCLRSVNSKPDGSCFAGDDCKICFCEGEDLEDCKEDFCFDTTPWNPKLFIYSQEYIGGKLHKVYRITNFICVNDPVLIYIEKDQPYLRIYRVDEDTPFGDDGIIDSLKEIPIQFNN
jgi:hypothetical protein